jgi:hypothetical protein
MATPKKKTRPRYNWSKIRAMWESGDSAYSISGSKGMPTRAAINRRAKLDEWTRNLEGIIQQKVSEKVSGIVSESDKKERAQLIDKESEKRATIEKMHREEPGHVRSLLYKGIKSQNDAESGLDKKLAQEDLKAAKLAMEIMKGVQEMERKSYRLETDTGSTGRAVVSLKDLTGG